MRLPRRVPWESLGELDYVCSLIYADENDIEAKVQALNRIAAWRAITSLPHALESTHALLCVIVEDSSRQGSTSYLSLRQSYASALIRLVNGLVDPLQFGAYARSIKSIADQLGLPQWLVELRHAATHEDLPSIEVLREAAKESMGWLLNNYFLPTLNPSAPATSRKAEMRPISPLLKRYKMLLKSTTRDVSLLPTWKHEITKALRDVARWVGEAKVAADVAGDALEWDERGGEDDPGEDEGRERWALDRLCDALLEKGALVPSSNKKKDTAMWQALACPPASVAIWQPLLSDLQSIYPSFSAVLVSRITSRLLARAAPAQEFGAEKITFEAADGQTVDTKRMRCLAAWAKWLVETWAVDVDEDEEAYLRREDVVISLVSGLGPAQEYPLQDSETVMALLHTLCDGHSRLQAVASSLSSIQKQPSAKWEESDFDVMQERLQAILATMSADETDTTKPLDVATSGRAGPDEMETDEQTQLPRGWRLLTERDGWKPSPIGVFEGVSA